LGRDIAATYALRKFGTVRELHFREQEQEPMPGCESSSSSIRKEKYFQRYHHLALMVEGAVQACSIEALQRQIVGLASLCYQRRLCILCVHLSAEHC
jgi:hypothetical protein